LCSSFDDQKIQELPFMQETIQRLVSENNQLRAEKKRDMRSILDSMPSLIAYWDRDLRNCFGNKAFRDWLGIDPAQLEGKHIRDVLGQERYQLNLPYIEAALRGERQQFERAIPSADGTQIRQSLAEYIPDIVDGKVQGFHVLVTDITASKQVELALREKTEKLSGLFELSQLGIARADMSGRFVQFNAAFCKITGYDAQELKTLDYWRLTPQKYADSEALQMETLKRTGRFGPYEKEYIRKDGNLVPLSLNGVSITGADGEQYIWSILEDITERKQTLLALANAKYAAEAANVAKSQFIATMSHELRTPLNGVLGMAQILMMPNVTEAERIDYANVVMESGMVLLTLIDEILEYSRIDAGEAMLQSGKLNPMHLIAGVQASFDESAHAKNLEVECDWSGSTTSYLGDSKYLKKMLSNLVSNAIKFTARGRIRIEAHELECSDQSGLLEFSVADTGVGIEQDKLHLLFQPFKQIDGTNSRSHGGVGIGLSIVRKLAERMGGEVGVESQLGQGSRFWFRVRLEVSG
jgi:PAS domain S-box-containing protein